VKVRIDVGLGYQVAAGVDLVRRLGVEALRHRGDATVSDADFDEPVAAVAEPCPANCNVKLWRHDCTTVCRGFSSASDQAARDFAAACVRKNYSLALLQPKI
jgi:hypothetical protein